MEEAREIRLRLLEVVGHDNSVCGDDIVDTFLGLERLSEAPVAKPEELADSAATDNAAPLSARARRISV